jgi:N-terminal acetyltransferase B complex non-catalytic subunit
MATPASMRTLLYKLAHRVLPKEPSLGHAPADRLHLHLTVLKELQLWDDAQQLLSQPIGEALCAASLSVEEQRRDIARLSGHWKEEGERAQDKILNKG